MKTNRTVVGVDTAKRVFQLHWVDMETGEIVDLKLTRAKFLEHFANLAPCVVAMEACGGSQHWARRLRRLGHEPWLLPAKAVRPFVAGNKNDAHDARAIWTAAQMPGIRTVAVKSEEQQAILALHRMRQQLVKFRTAQINGLRGLLTEYGEVMPQGRAGMRRGMADALERVSERLPAMVIDTLREQWARVARLDEEVGEIERRIGVWHRGNADSRRIAESGNPMSGIPTRSRYSHEPQTICAVACSGWRSRTANGESPPSGYSGKSRYGGLSTADPPTSCVTPTSLPVGHGHPWRSDYPP